MLTVAGCFLAAVSYAGNNLPGHIALRHNRSALKAVRAWPQFSAPADWLAIVTAAHSSGGPNDQEREKEYRRGLAYFFSRFQSVVGVVSSTEPMPIISEFDFQQALYFSPSSQYTQKSAKESEALRYLVTKLNETVAPKISESAIVFKASGRYQVVRDDFLEAVMMNPEYDVWAKSFGSWALDDQGHHVVKPGDAKLFTFYFAMRWPIFRDIYMHVDLDKLESYDTIPSKGWKGYDIESYLMDVVKERGLRLWRAPYLHVIANIDNAGLLTYF